MGDETIDLDAQRAAWQRQHANQTLRDLPGEFADIGRNAWTQLTDPRLMRRGAPLPWVNVMTQLLRDTAHRQMSPDESVLRENYASGEGRAGGGNVKEGYPGEGRTSKNVVDKRKGPETPPLSDEEWRLMLAELLRSKAGRLPVPTVGEREWLRSLYGDSDPAAEVSRHYQNSLATDEFGTPMIPYKPPRPVD